MSSNNIIVKLFQMSDLEPDLLHRILFYGFSLYKGVLVVWDWDRDKRLLKFIDNLDNDIRESLLITTGSKGKMKLIWDGVVPQRYEKGDTVLVNTIYWNIEESTGIWFEI